MNISRQQWLTETTEYKIIAWEYESDVTIDGVPLGEAIASDTELLEDACRWMDTSDISMLSSRRRRTFEYFVPDNIIGGMITRGEPERADEMVSMNDLKLYYYGTVNYADGKICRIIGSNNKGMICSPLEGGKAFITKDLKPINDIVTGFVNTPVGCIKCFRKPTRTAKEGINTESIETGSTIPWDSYPNEFMDMLNNIYPSEEEAIKIAKEEHINVAVSKFKYYDWITAEFIDILKKSNKERVRYELD